MRAKRPGANGNRSETTRGERDQGRNGPVPLLKKPSDLFALANMLLMYASHLSVLVMSGHIKNNKYHILTEYMTVSLNHQQISMRFEMIHYHTVMICNRHEFVTRKILTLTHRHLFLVILFYLDTIYSIQVNKNYQKQVPVL